MKRPIYLVAVAILSMSLFIGCAPSSGNTPQPPQDTSGSRLILSEAMAQKNIKLEDVKSIELYDLDDKPVGKPFTDEDIKNIMIAYNESMIDDTSYIKMITGYRMIITLKNDKKVNLTSYGAEDRVVVGGDDFSYHLISPELANILLNK